MLGFQAYLWRTIVQADYGHGDPTKFPKPGDPTLKIVTFNINNINKRLDNLVAWLAKTKPDVVCLQELKAEQLAFPAHTLRTLDESPDDHR